jgi:glutaredoxin
MLKQIEVEGNLCSIGYALMIAYECPFCKKKKRNKLTKNPKFHYHGVDRTEKNALIIHRGNHCEPDDIPIEDRPNYLYDFVIKNNGAVIPAVDACS